MGVQYNSRIVTDSLVLAFDAGNPKNYNLTAVEVLVVAGGGGGGTHHGGGGGAGGLIYNSSFAVTPGSALTVTVGDGGAAGTYSPNANGSNGGNSVFGSLTAIGGGGGGTYNNNGNSGGSGGGANNWSGSKIGGSETSGQGFGGASNNGQTNYGGGGGGAGGTAKGLSNNSGGDGLYFAQFSSVGGSPAGWFAGGGAAGVYPGYVNDTSYGTGGLGGGGNGGNGPHGSGTGKTNGTANTGGGGGGSADLYQTGASGGSGIVIVRYPGPQRAIGGTVTSSGGYTIHTFTTVGSTTFTPLAATNDSTILGLADFSGNNNFGTTANSPVYSSSFGGSVAFDGINEYATFSISNLTTQITVESWIYPERAPSTGTIRGGAISGNPNHYFGIFNSIDGGVTHSLHWALQTSSTRPGSQVGNIPRYAWSHIVGTYDGSRMKAYINGSLVYDVALTGTINGNGNWTLGCYQPSPTDGTHNFDGYIGPSRIYNRALTSQEIQQNYNATKSRFQ